ncbi:universal stress protein [Gulosibacter sp. ACHW.36C]|uniref:Universal stress protein n=1 Tax=Gulosibacter sediminis TaxID=1729695 RepID=A0ABY4N0E7_9MICO|nr:universal stress protein [Gulosibacter sediminis]UQN15101.1 universal stress protein [Gulosibacter sediminis]
MASRIVVGINGSSADTSAVAWAATEVAREGGTLLIFSVIAAGGAGGELEPRAKELLAEHAAAARAIAPNAELRTEVHHAKSLPEGFEEVSADADLLVIGRDSHGRRSRSPGAVRIAAASKAPVVAVPEIDLGNRRGVVVGTDGSEPSRLALEFAASVANSREVPLIAVISWQLSAGLGYEYAYGEDFAKATERSSAEELDRALEPIEAKYPNLEIQRVVMEGHPVDVLTKAAEKARLLVVGTHGRGAFRRLLLGSVSHELLQDVTLPTVIVR